MTRHTLPGLQPQPLATYLAGLGLTRLLGEQPDPTATAAWTGSGLAVDTTVDDIATWLVDDYVPTPVLSPWNGGSGFGQKGKAQREALAALLALPGPRLDSFRQAMTVAAEVAQRSRTDGWEKGRTVRELRNRCPDSLLPWIDATVVLANDQVYFPPLLGTGGNDGRLEFSHTLHKRLREVLDPEPAARRRSAAYARDLLSGQQSEQLTRAMMGQFDPAGAGGKGSSPFGDAESLGNPWLFVLLVEGALLFAASAARRQLHGARRAAMPFTVFASPDGSSSGAEGESSRGEVWAPVWDRPFTLPEIRQLFTEARASWRGRPAQRAADFYASTRTLGVARGIGAFTRYGLHQRNGLAFVAVPIDHVEVRAEPDVHLAAQLEDWVSWVRRGESTTAVGRAVRRFDGAHLSFVRDGGALRLARLLAALTNLEQAAGRSSRVRENVPVRRPPAAAPFLRVLVRESGPELRVAVGLASCATRPRAGGQPSRAMRQLLLPVDPEPRWRQAPVVPGFGARPLVDVLADVLAWRSRTAPEEADVTTFRGVPTFRYGVPVPAGDLHAFAAGQLNGARLDLLLRACLALRWDGVRHDWNPDLDLAVPVPTLALLHPLAAGLALDGADPGTPRLALAPDWAVRLAAGQVGAVHGEAVRRLHQAGWHAVPPLAHIDANGAAIAAALVPRCRRPISAMADRVAVRIRTDRSPVDSTDDHTERSNELAEETS